MFWDNFYNLCMQKNIKPNKVAKDLEFSNATVTIWKKGSQPTAEKIIKIADYFGITTDKLLGREQTPPGTDPDEMQLLTNYRATDQKGKDRIQYSAEVEAKRTKQEEAQKRKQA